MTPLTWWQQLLITTVLIAAIVGALQGLFSFMTWVERRLLAFMQFRLGPNRAGPFGLLQPIADGIKLFFKEELIPAQAHRWGFVAAPVVAVVTAFLSIAVVPYGGPVTLPVWVWPAWLQGRTIPLQIADLDVGILFLFAISSLGVYAIVLAGWSANNKYTLMGGLRSSAQMFSYELSLGLSWVGVILLTGWFRPDAAPLKIASIVDAQQASLLHWYVIWQFPAFVIYMLAATAEVNRLPFDLAEAEAELVAGFHTEYGSMKFALIQMAEYVNMITVTVLATNLFLGGWYAPHPVLQSAFGINLGFLWFVAKVACLLFFFIWMRGTLPRLRYDQLMQFGWKVLLPVAVVNILLTALLILVFKP